jgi:hypothetical protein
LHFFGFAKGFSVSHVASKRIKPILADTNELILSGKTMGAL